MLDGLNFLIVEDEPIIAFNLEDILISLGCERVYLATHIEEALQLLEENDVDGAVLDVNIHGERSYPLAAELQRRSVRFIFATGYGDAEHPGEFASVPTLTKPYSSASLIAALRLASTMVAGDRSS